MSLTLDAIIERLINEKRTIEKCYVEITTWPENMQEEAKAALMQKCQEGRFDVAVRYRSCVFVNKKEADKSPVVLKKKLNFLQKLFKK
jgi:hypothetical protein